MKQDRALCNYMTPENGLACAIAVHLTCAGERLISEARFWDCSGPLYEDPVCVLSLSGAGSERIRILC